MFFFYVTGLCKIKIKVKHCETKGHLIKLEPVKNMNW